MGGVSPADATHEVELAVAHDCTDEICWHVRRRVERDPCACVVNERGVPTVGNEKVAVADCAPRPSAGPVGSAVGELGSGARPGIENPAERVGAVVGIRSAAVDGARGRVDEPVPDCEPVGAPAGHVAWR